MPPKDSLANEPFYQPPPPTGDLRTMLRRRIVATALDQIARYAAERSHLRKPAQWRAYAARIRRRFVAAVDAPGLRLAKTWRVRPGTRKSFDGFSIENLLIESLPGCW